MRYFLEVFYSLEIQHINNADDLTETIENLTDDAEKLKADAEKKAETLKKQEDTLKEALKSAKDNGFGEYITAPL